MSDLIFYRFFENYWFCVLDIGKIIYFFFWMKCEGNRYIYFIGLLWWLKEVIYIKYIIILDINKIFSKC